MAATQADVEWVKFTQTQEVDWKKLAVEAAIILEALRASVTWELAGAVKARIVCVTNSLREAVMRDAKEAPTCPRQSAPERVKELEAAIRDVVMQRADDLCWFDVYTKLAGLVGLDLGREVMMLPAEDMLVNCARYVKSLKTGCPYATDNTTLQLRRVDEALAYLQARGLLQPGDLLDNVYALVERVLATESRATAAEVRERLQHEDRGIVLGE